MITLPKATAPSAPKVKYAPKLALVYAAIIVVLAVTQLFSFEKFQVVVQNYSIPGGVAFAALLSAIIVISEVFALPFLLRMRLSKAMRIVSMWCGWLVALIWYLINLWILFKPALVDDIGLFGGLIALHPGWLAISVSIVLGVLAGIVSWGMWPLAHKK